MVREASERLATKMARWQRIAAAAARQCGRRTLLDVQPPMALRDFCVRYGSAPVKLVCWEEERQQGIRQVLESLTGQSPIVLVIGPEGGLTVHEVEMARTEGFTTVSLGSHLLPYRNISNCTHGHCTLQFRRPGTLERPRLRRGTR